MIFCFFKFCCKYNLQTFIFASIFIYISMTSNIVGDAKYQELNMSFSFVENQDGKLIVKALAHQTHYRLQLGQGMDFQDIKNALINRQFKVVSKSPEILKLKVGFIFLEFKKDEKIIFNALRQTITNLTDDLKDQSVKNNLLQTTVNKMKVQFDLIASKIVDLTRFNDERTQQNAKLSKEQSELIKSHNESKEEIKKLENQLQKLTKDYVASQNDASEVKRELGIMTEKYNAQALQITGFEDKIREYQNLTQSLRQEFSSQKSERQSDKKRLKENEEKIEEQKKIIEKLQKRLSELEGNEEKTSEKLQKMNQSLLQIRNELESNKASLGNVEKKIAEEQELRKEQQEKMYTPQKHHSSTKKSTKFVFKQLNQNSDTKSYASYASSKFFYQKQLFSQFIPPYQSDYIFSYVHKSKRIQLTNNNSTATISEENFSPVLGLVQGVVLQNGSSIWFKIQSVGRYVSVGLGIRNVIAANSYKFKDGDGCFLISAGGNSYSHSNKDHNDVSTSFQYGKGDVIQVETNGDELLFRNETRKWDVKIEISLTEEEWKQACFCVASCGFGDSVSIL